MRHLRPVIYFALRGFTAVALLALPAFASLPPQQPRMPRAVLTDTDAYLVGEPHLLVGPRILDVFPSPDGVYAIILRNESRLALEVQRPSDNSSVRDGTLEVLLWNRRTGRMTAMWSVDAADGVTASASQVEWMNGRGIAFVSVFRKEAPGTPAAATKPNEEGKLLLVDVRATRARVIADCDHDYLLTSPGAPVAVLERVRTQEERDAGTHPTLRVVRPDGSVSPPVTVQESLSLWSPIAADGSAIYGVLIGEKDAKTGRRKRTTYSVNLTSGAATPVGNELPEDYDAREVSTIIAHLPVQLETVPSGLLHNGAREPLDAVYLSLHTESRAPSAATASSSEKPVAAAALAKDTTALIATDAEAVTLLADGTAALYRSRGGSLWAAPIEKQDRNAFVNARKTLYQTMTRDRAKQIATGLLMYTEDYDGTLPFSGGPTQDQLQPYLRSLDAFRDPDTGDFAFTYVHPGVANQTQIKDPASSTLGYLTGPGGRAVIYADGHVSWEDK